MALILASLFAATLLGALPPVARRWGDRGLHLFIAASAGIFLGTVFLHLLPELAAISGHDHHGGGEHGAGGDPLPWFAALAGFLGLFLLEKVWLRGKEERGREDPHAVVWVSTYIGLAAHAFTAGLGLSAVALEGLVLVPILWHKVTESFSLTSVLRLAGVGAGKTWALLGSFALATPLGYIFGEGLFARGGEASAVLMGLACGTFLYVAACDLLPEVFHHLERRTPRILALLMGILSTALVPHAADGGVDAGWLGAIASSSWEVYLAMAPYLLFGFLIAGFLGQWLSPAWLSRWLARDDLRSIGLASLVGAPLPLCSCSVVPVAASLRRAGASKGATSAFLVATPETGVDSVTVTYGLLDPLMTVARPLASVLSAVLTGLGVAWLVRSGADDDVDAGLERSEAESEAESCCEDACDSDVAPRSGGLLGRVLRYAFVDLVDDLGGALLLGVLLSGVIGALVPESALTEGVLGGVSGVFLMLLVGIPVYVCAAASTPIAAALVLKGLSPGAALVFLLAGPATNLATLSVMTRYLGRRAVVVHLAVLATVTVTLGLGLDALYGVLGIEASARLGEEPAELQRWLGLGCAALLAVLLLASLSRRLKASGSDHEHSH